MCLTQITSLTFQIFSIHSGYWPSGKATLDCHGSGTANPAMTWPWWALKMSPWNEGFDKCQPDCHNTAKSFFWRQKNEGKSDYQAAESEETLETQDKALWQNWIGKGETLFHTQHAEIRLFLHFWLSFVTQKYMFRNSPVHPVFSRVSYDSYNSLCLHQSHRNITAASPDKNWSPEHNYCCCGIVIHIIHTSGPLLYIQSSLAP